MATPLQSIVEAGTRLWLDSIDPDLVYKYHALGATGATSNPIIVTDLIRSGRFDDRLGALLGRDLDDAAIAWAMTDRLVRDAQAVFLPIWQRTGGDDGYVSFELDPLLEDVDLGPPHGERVDRYVELGRRWAAGQPNRMIKVPATPAGLDALEPLAAAGVTLNVTLVFTPRQYRVARENVWRGARRRVDGLDGFKSVYSVFISRVDVYTEKHVPELGPDAQGLVGLVNVKRIWSDNRDFWSDKGLKLKQEIVFASTGTKRARDPADKYIAALVGDGIQTNPPATNDLIATMGKHYGRTIEHMPGPAVLETIDRLVDPDRMEQRLMAEGIAKFADPHKALLQLIASKRAALAAR